MNYVEYDNIVRQEDELAQAVATFLHSDINLLECRGCIVLDIEHICMLDSSQPTGTHSYP